MVKKAVTIRLDEDTLKEIDDRGKRSNVIRNMIESALKPKLPPRIIQSKPITIIKEIPVETIRYITKNPFDFTNMTKEIEREVINDDIRKGLPKWYLDYKIKDWERKYNEEFK